MNGTRFPRTEREAFQRHANPDRTQRESKLVGRFHVPLRVRMKRVLRELFR